ncbi:nucleotide pyrophosphohydrolase [Archaeoglobales archaeon]|nr:MAG: nucleotide pyrophosphohydrolase [Archaeoglobales archaeon]
MELEKLRSKIGEKYLETDRNSGPLFLLAVLMEEVGELAEAVRRGEKEAIREELSDVLFMVISLSNLFEVDVESRLIEKYIKEDPRARWDLP